MPQPTTAVLAVKDNEVDARGSPDSERFGDLASNAIMVGDLDLPGVVTRSGSC